MLQKLIFLEMKLESLVIYLGQGISLIFLKLCLKWIIWQPVSRAKIFIWQLQQFLKPFPEKGSWAYQWQTSQYDKKMGAPDSGKDLVIDEPLEEAVDYGIDEDDLYSIPSYVRRHRSLALDTSDDESIINNRNRPVECDEW